jgi:hypothetical protein
MINGVMIESALIIVSCQLFRQPIHPYLRGFLRYLGGNSLDDRNIIQFEYFLLLFNRFNVTYLAG